MERKADELDPKGPLPTKDIKTDDPPRRTSTQTNRGRTVDSRTTDKSRMTEADKADDAEFVSNLQDQNWLHVGDTVITRGITTGGNNEHPGLVTGLYNEEGPDGSVLVDMTVFPRASRSEVMVKVPVFDSKDDALAANEATMDPERQPLSFVAWKKEV